MSKIALSRLLLLAFGLYSTAHAGYIEINNVGDKRESYRMNVAQSTSTDSKVPQQASQEAIYYTPSK